MQCNGLIIKSDQRGLKAEGKNRQKLAKKLTPSFLTDPKFWRKCDEGTSLSALLSPHRPDLSQQMSERPRSCGRHTREDDTPV